MSKKNKNRIVFSLSLGILLIANVFYSYGENSTKEKNTTYLNIDSETGAMTYYLNGNIVRGTIIILDGYVDSNTDVFFFEPVVLFAGYDGVLQEIDKIRNKMDKQAVKELTEGLTKNKSKNELQVGDSYFFGRYEQDDTKENGRERIEWIVIKAENDKLHLLSKKVLDFLDFDEKWISEFSSKSFIEDELEQMIAMGNKKVNLYDENIYNYEKLATYPSAYAYHKGIDVMKENKDLYMNCSFKTASGKIIGPDGKTLDNYKDSEFGFRPMICVKR